MVGSKHEAMGPIWWKESTLFLTPNLFLGSAEGTPSIALLFNTRGIYQQLSLVPLDVANCRARDDHR